jgi:predicted aminopeptidase
MHARREEGAAPPPQTSRRLSRALLVLACCGLLAGCDTLSYYTQAVGGQLELISRARPIDAVLVDPGTSADLRLRLERARTVREYASRALGLPDNGSYRSYADLGRPYVVWNVFAAPEFATTAVKSCFPVAGCVSYRGFFAEADAQREAAKQRAAGHDVLVLGTPAYSTLGWFDDPLLSTFIRYPESEVARLVFHELAHQVVYVKNDTAFNESFAVAVERAGVRRWLVAQDRQAELAAFLAGRERREEFIALIAAARARLERIYAEESVAEGSTAEGIESRRAKKRAAFDELKREYAALKARWGGFSGYDRILGAEPNNALLVSLNAYSKYVPGFERILEGAGGDLPRFYAAVKRIAALPEQERSGCLEAQAAPAIRSAGC